VEEKSMDESARIIIATVSGFLIALLAEPIKLFFQDHVKRQNIRRAIYSEIISNYLAFDTLFGKNLESKIDWIEDSGKFSDEFAHGIRHLIKIDCFTYAVTQEATAYYQMKEATSFNYIYSTLKAVLEWAEMNKTTQKSSRLRPQGFIEEFVRSIKENIRQGSFDRRLVKSIVGKRDLDILK